MKMHLSLTFGALLLVAATVQSARIEDLQDQLELLTDSFRQTAQGDKHLSDLRERIMTAQEVGVRKEAFDEYKGKLADLLEAQDRLMQQVNGVLVTASGLSFDKSPDLKHILDSFDNDLRDIEGSLKLLEASSLAMRSNQEFSRTGEILAKNLAQMRKAFAVLIRERRALLDEDTGKFDKAHLASFLQALKISAATRQQTLFFEFAMTAQAARITDYYDQLRNLYATLLQGKSFAIYMRDLGISNLESANYLAELNDILSDETFVLPNPVNDLEIEKVLLEVKDLEEFYPYERLGRKFYFDPQLDQWYTRMEKRRVYCPVDDEAGSGKFTRMHADGFFYSHAPWYDQPRQLTFTEDWIAEIQHN